MDSEPVKPTVLLDVDGVIVDYTRAYVEEARRIIRRDIPFEERQSWHIHDTLGLNAREHALVEAELHKPGAAQRMHAYQDAVEGVRTLMEIANVVFVTAQSHLSQTWCYDRDMWLVRNFGIDRDWDLIFTHAKQHVFGHMFVDDRVRNVVTWRKAWAHLETKAVIWDHPFNRPESDPQATGLTRATNWATVISLATGIAERLNDHG